MKNKNIYKILLAIVLLLSFSPALAINKPGNDADPDKLSYVFYLYYDKGMIYGDRDYEIKFDVLNEGYVPGNLTESVAYKGEIVNFKSESSKKFLFDPKEVNAQLIAGKLMVKAPYVADAQQVNFFNPQGQQLLTIFVTAASICNDDGSCTTGAGENDKTCPNDCKKPRPTPAPVVTQESSSFLGLGLDLNSILIYLAGTVIVAMAVWFGWRWWKKRRESAFIPPVQSPPQPPPLPGIDLGENNLNK